MPEKETRSTRAASKVRKRPRAASVNWLLERDFFFHFCSSERGGSFSFSLLLSLSFSLSSLFSLFLFLFLPSYPTSAAILWSGLSTVPCAATR